ncbi:MAG: glycoside hydrolase family 3 N-terminal domain-containing protein, partial [Spirochaetales bacterium]|nr:glycoside hydrolase family 3 N-terminal domain-containing protein [Spirochaetales bacterium]
ASLSYPILNDYLREELQFKGLIITDAMDMGAIKSAYSPEDAAVAAFSAGTDILLMPEHIPSAQQAIKTAVQDGRISEERLNSSLERIIRLKFEKGMFKSNYKYVEKISDTYKKSLHSELKSRLITE